MNGLTAHEWIRATIIADVFHWGVLGLIALLGYAGTLWLRRRTARKTAHQPAVPTLRAQPNPQCVCSSCGRVHWHASMELVPVPISSGNLSNR